MAQCGICEEKEGVREAGVYMDGEKKAVPVCAGCVYEAMRRNFYGIGFGAGLYGLVRLALLLAARVALRGAKAKEGPVPDWVWKRAMAQAVTEDALRDAYAEQFCNVKVQTPREYERLHPAK